MQQEAGGKRKERAAISSGTGVGGAVVSENGVDSEIHLLQSEETASQGSEVSRQKLPEVSTSSRSATTGGNARPR